MKYYLLILTFTLSACTHVDDGAKAHCPDNRPQVCTREYAPVCAQLADGKRKTYSNACTACADTRVTGYQPSACE